jgi:hypothetical protein
MLDQRRAAGGSTATWVQPALTGTPHIAAPERNAPVTLAFATFDARARVAAAYAGGASSGQSAGAVVPCSSIVTRPPNRSTNPRHAEHVRVCRSPEGAASR